MKTVYWVLLVLLACGCVGEVPQATSTSTTQATLATTTTLEDEVVVVMPQDTIQTTTTETDAPLVSAPTSSTIVSTATSTTLDPLITTFIDNGGPICTHDGKPIIRMYGKIDCEHCVWVAPIFDKVVREYMANGSIAAHHWLFDNNGNGMDGNDTIPQEDSDLFFGTNQQTVPYFNFGCRFTRSGNGYYVRNRPDLEETEFRAVINQLLATEA